MAATSSKAASTQKRPRAEREFTTPMQLTSPVEKSDRVRDGYWLLSGHNVFEQDFHPGKNDGKYGPAAASAARRAKEMLGYPDSGIDNVFGQQLFDYLTGKVELPPAYAKRRQAKLEALNPAKNAKNKAVDAALKDFEDHVTETPVNMTPFGKWYGMDGVFWCCIYVSYRLANAGFDGFERGKFASYCGHVVDAAKRHERGLAITNDPERGDIVIYNNDEHIEFFVEWVKKGESFKAVGGNTSTGTGSPSNGGAVGLNTRRVKDTKFPATWFIRVGA